MEEEFGRLPRDTEIAIFRVVQEALTNVYKHSGSPDGIIRVLRVNSDVRVEVEDHGRGMLVISGPQGAKMYSLEWELPVCASG
jgi:signal transduction histidine kinase